MATTAIITGDTVTVQGTFTDEDDALIDADNEEVTLTVYDADTRAEIFNGPCTKRSIGVYYYDYTVPSTEQGYFFELAGFFAGKPQLKRVKVKAKFKV